MILMFDAILQQHLDQLNIQPTNTVGSLLCNSSLGAGQARSHACMLQSSSATLALVHTVAYQTNTHQRTLEPHRSNCDRAVALVYGQWPKLQ
jgi:hypothetical protein